MTKQAIIAILMLALGLGAGYWLASRQMVHEQPVSTPAEPRKPLFYRNPMNPDVTSPVPAKDSMGMDYIPVYADEEQAEEKAGTVKIDPMTTQNIGVRTARASRQTLSQGIRAVGRVAYDEERIVRLHPKTEGWIEAMSVDKTGQWVKKNTDLLSVYSPQLVASQQEYVLALKNLEVLKKSPIEEIRRGAEELVNSSRERLKLLDVPEHQLHDLTHTHEIKKSLHIHTPAAGIVIEIGAREGQYVTPATQLYMIADLSKVWVYADIYEYELPWVREGDPVEMRLAGVPGKVFKGHLAFIYPYAEAKTRTIKVRLVFDNTELLLKPDMFAEVTIQAGRRQEALVIPAEAVVRSSAGDRVFVVQGDGRFEPRTVRLGLASNGHIEIREGLAEGEEVVTSAQFLIDSESNLREATKKMMAPEPHQHD
ncbi:efflux RND transporter periplasmic adaptor subunit [Methylobacter luteus]|uniref:efflux RND transporter periplasmic adaptor subunit n=1 Tax=Methylobacter luteus TaxID=415 RepID=UPI0018CB2510|nr:efflux RND transporter periplasmic adaptor subunit [Methylobacter luteus]